MKSWNILCLLIETSECQSLSSLSSCTVSVEFGDVHDKWVYKSQMVKEQKLSARGVNDNTEMLNEDVDGNLKLIPVSLCCN